jgi:threonyl-tRNA synthetase
VGDKEEQSANVAVRDRAGREARGVPLEAFVARAIVENESRALETGDVEDF